jgi:hypothetical protein
MPFNKLPCFFPRQAQGSGEHGFGNEVARIPKTSRCSNEGQIVKIRN